MESLFDTDEAFLDIESGVIDSFHFVEDVLDAFWRGHHILGVRSDGRVGFVMEGVFVQD